MLAQIIPVPSTVMPKDGHSNVGKVAVIFVGGGKNALNPEVFREAAARLEEQKGTEHHGHRPAPSSPARCCR
jgi:hypothetical protein